MLFDARVLSTFIDFVTRVNEHPLFRIVKENEYENIRALVEGRWIQ